MKQNQLWIFLLILIVGNVNEMYASRYHSEEIALLQAFLAEPAVDPENSFLNWELLYEEDPTSWDADNEGWGEFPGLAWSEDEDNKRLTSISFSGMSYLSGILDISKMEMLEELDCSANQILEIILSENQKSLFLLNCNRNLLTELKLPSGLSSLEYLECSDNQLTELLLPDDLNLTDLSCHANHLSFKNLLELEAKVEGYYEYHSQTLTLEVRPGRAVQMEQLGLYTGEGEVFYQMEDGKQYELEKIFQVPAQWKDGDEKIITMIHNALPDFEYEGAEYLLTLIVKTVPEQTYYSIDLSTAHGIELSEFIDGKYDVEEGNSFTIDFTLSDPDATIDDILCLLDDTEVDVEAKEEGVYRLRLDGIVEDMTVHLAMKNYNVTLTETEGVALLPTAGVHTVAYKEPFEFSVTLDEVYNESEPKVYANEKLIEGELLAGIWHYLLESVIEPVEITIEEVKKNPTSNQPEVTPVVIYSIEGNLVVETPITQLIQVYSPTGKLLISEKVDGKAFIPLSSGVYLVNIEGRVEKVIVK